ncbi:hypothetical protein PPYR_02118, partial [Photinus pyralis]
PNHLKKGLSTLWLLIIISDGRLFHLKAPNLVKISVTPSKTSNRPDPNDILPLTPGHFLIGEPAASVVEPNYMDLRTNRLSQVPAS